MDNNSAFLADEEATLELGKRLGAALQAPAAAEAATGGQQALVIYLLGDLGAGKTTLSRGLLRAFGYSGAVKSPTYTLVEPYEFDQRHIYHFDLYRLADPEEVEYLGTDDYFRGPNICLVEWAERGRGAIPEADLCIRLKTEGGGRRAELETASEIGAQLLERMWRQGRN